MIENPDLVVKLVGENTRGKEHSLRGSLGTIVQNEVLLILSKALRVLVALSA